MPLESLNVDILFTIAELLSGKDLVSFSRASRYISASISETIWEKFLSRDFGVQGLRTRNVLRTRCKNISWQETYCGCVDSRLYLWGDLYGLFKQPFLCLKEGQSYENRTTDEYRLYAPQQIQLPGNLVARDVGLCDALYVLTIEGQMRCMHIRKSLQLLCRTIEMEFNSDIDLQPGPFSEMAVSETRVFALDTESNWWVWDRWEWSMVFIKTRTWPGTFSATLAGQIVALSECGRYIFVTDESGVKSMVEIPWLAAGPPLQKIDSFIVQGKEGPSTRRQDALVCVQYDGQCFAVVCRAGTHGPVFSFRLDIDSTIIDATLVDRNLGPEHAYSFELVCSNGDIIRSHKYHPSQFVLYRQVDLRFIYKQRLLGIPIVRSFSTTCGGLFCSREARTLPTGHTVLETAANGGALSILPPVTKFCIDRYRALALCSPHQHCS